MVPEEEVFRSSIVKNCPALTAEDMRTFAQWLHTKGAKTVKSEMTRYLANLQVKRWARWHVFCPDNPIIFPSLGMYFLH